MVYRKANRRSFEFLTVFALVLTLSLSIVPVSSASPHVGVSENPVVASRDGNKVTLSTGVFTLRFTGVVGDVPKFQFWYNNSGRNRTIYQVFFHQLFEFNDTTGDGAYNATLDQVRQMLALPSANLSLIGPEKMTNGVRFNFTISGMRGQSPSGANIILQCSLYNETVSVADGVAYNITGGAELKIDVIIDSWPWKDDDNLLCLRWSVNNQDMTLEPSISDNRVTLGAGYFSWISQATVYNDTYQEPANVSGSFNMTGKTANVYLTYPNFQNKSLRHDPSLGVTPPVEIPGLPPEANIFDHSDQVPINFPLNVTANTTAFMFQNFVLLTNSTKSVNLNLTVDSQITTRYFLLSLQPGESLNLDINVTVIPPTEVPSHNHSIGIYLDLEPDSTQVEVSATLGLHINQAMLEAELGRQIDVSTLTWAYWNGTEWVGLESYINDDGYLVAQTTHFSNWTVIPEFSAGRTLLLILILLSASIVVLGKRLTQKATNPDRTV